MHPIKDSFDVSYLQEALPAVEKKDKTIFLNFGVTIPEICYLSFVKSGIKTSLEKNIEIIFLGASEVMQKTFNEFLATLPIEKFSTEELKLNTIISSIWEKTKLWINNELTLLNNAEFIENEKKLQEIANTTTSGFNKSGHPGICFTARQARHLVKTIETVEAENKKILDLVSKNL